MPDIREVVAEAHHREWARVLAAVVRLAGDIDAAEEAVQEAFVAALEVWPARGVPRNPTAWLTTTARHRALDRLRRERTLTRKLPLLVVPDGAGDEPEEGDEVSSIPDERLRLIFTCCHPALALEARVALTLRLVCGLTTAEIAHAFLVSEPTMAARLTRAKHKIRAAGIPYRVPPDHLLPERLPAVLAAIYLVFTEGHTASLGDSLVRDDLATRALDLARLLVAMMPDEPEALGLLALLLLTQARRAARLDAAGGLVLLADQDRGRWDRAMLDEGRALVVRALRRSRPPGGPYALQAAIAAVHADAPAYDDTDWPQIVALYDALLRAQPSPVVALNRAVAVAMADGPAAGLALLDRLAADGRLASYGPLPAARADLLRRLGRHAEAADAYRAALALAGTAAERAFLRHRLDEIGRRGPSRRRGRLPVTPKRGEHKTVRYLFMSMHYPRPEYRDDLLRSMQRFGAALRAQPGLLQLANFDDAAHGRIIAVSIWESAEQFHAGRARAAASLPDDTPFDRWETRPHEVFALEETVAAPVPEGGGVRR